MRIAVDDFGTGYSSLAYLRDLPIDQLKLDRSFVSPMTGDVRAAALVSSTAILAHSLGLTMVAEGIDDGRRGHRGWRGLCGAGALRLRSGPGLLHVEAGSGGRFRRPISTADFDVWLARRHPEAMALWRRRDEPLEIVPPAG